MQCAAENRSLQAPTYRYFKLVSANNPGGREPVNKQLSNSLHGMRQESRRGVSQGMARQCKSSYRVHVMAQLVSRVVTDIDSQVPEVPREVSSRKQEPRWKEENVREPVWLKPQPSMHP